MPETSDNAIALRHDSNAVEDRVPDPFDTIITGDTYVISVIRRSTKDAADGSVILAFEAKAADIPTPLIAAPQNTLFHLEVESEQDTFSVFAARQPIRDLAKNSAELRFAALAGDIPPALLYGQRNAEVSLSLAILSGCDKNPYSFDVVERQRILRQLCIIANDPLFADWLEHECLRHKIPILYPRIEASRDEFFCGDGPQINHAERATEYVYRLARIHSRSEILNSSPIAHTVKTIIQAYRQSLWATNALPSRFD